MTSNKSRVFFQFMLHLKVFWVISMVNSDKTMNQENICRLIDNLKLLHGNTPPNQSEFLVFVSVF